MDGAGVKRGKQREEQNKKEGKGKEMVRGRGNVELCHDMLDMS